MSDEWSDPIAILHNVVAAIVVAPDVDLVTKTDNLMTEREAERTAERDQVQRELRVLSKKLAASQSLAVRKPTQPSEKQHAETIAALDTSRYALGKDINEKQTASAKMDIEITRLREEHDELVRDRDEFEKDGGAVDQLDGEALLVSLSNSVGFTLVPSLEPGGEPTRILVRNDASSDVQSVARLGPSERDDPAQRAAFADRLWNLAGTA